MSNLENILERAERNQERLAALIRLVVFVTLLVAVLSIRQEGSHHHPLLSATIAYGGLAIAGLWLAWRDVYRRWIPYAFVTCEVVLIAAQVVLLGRLMAMSNEMAIATPIAGLIFVQLVHAAMRYRPWLVVYGAVLFAFSVGIGRVLVESASSATSMHAMHGTARPDFYHFFHYEIFPVVTLLLATLILFVTTRGTRRLLHQSLDNTLKVARLSRFFSSKVAGHLATDSDEHLMRGKRRPVAVLFADIRGFSAMAEHLSPEDLGNLITAYRERLAQDVENWSGAVDKFIGDGVMAVFGIPDTESDDSGRALNCALDMIRSMEQWTAERALAGEPAVSIGIGLHRGEVFAGVLGRDHLLEFTVIGDTVNVAERLERLTRQFDAHIVASSDLVAATGERLPIPPWTLVEHNRLAGREQTLDVYVLPRNTPDDLAIARLGRGASKESVVPSETERFEHERT